MEIHLRGVYAAQTNCRVYLFREASGNMEGVQIGEMRLANGAGDFGVILNAGRIKDTPFGIGDMEGIFLGTGDNRIFMSRWKEGAPLIVDQAHLKEWQPTPEPQSQPRDAAQGIAEAKEQVSERQPGVDVPPKTAAQDLAGTQEQRTMPQSAENENVQATEIPMRNFFPDYRWEEIWEKLCGEHPVLAPLADREARCIQIELKDLKELPKKYWYLGNNSFLLHGFFNYRYLVVGKTGEERWFIGVPGIYQRQERVMAAIFGFPEFLAAAVQSEGEEAPEGEPVNRFGCWCRYIEE